MYTPLLQDLSSSNNKVIFINVSMGALGVMGSSCDSFLSVLQDLSFDKVTQRRIIMKTIITLVGQHITSSAKEINHGTTLNS